MSKVSITRSLLDDLAMSISAKSGEAVPMTLTEMKNAVDSIQTGGQPNLQTKTKTYTPTESAQTEIVSADSGYDGIDTVSISVGAISSTYVGTGITRRSSSDLTASGATVTVPSGYYSAQASKAVASGSAGTPTATKGTVSNHQVAVTPSVTNTTGYITGGTKTGTAVSVSASELVSGTYTVDSSGTKDVANYASASVPAGTAGTPSASKGAVSSHSVTVTPSVTNTTGWITGSTKTGTAVTVSASELVSGTYSVTSSGTKDVTNYASASVPSGTEGTPTATKGAVSNHSVSITPSVTNTGGFISGSTKTGTAVTVSASELVSGSQTITSNQTVDVTNLAELVVAVSGSGGLEYETGTLTPTSDASTPIISFSNTHTDMPSYINIVDVTGTTATTSSNLYWTFMNWYTAFGAIVKTTNSANMYGRYQYGYKSSSGASAGNIDCTTLTGSNQGSLYYLVESGRFGPYCGSGNRYWRSGRTYKWIAVWAPTA